VFLFSRSVTWSFDGFCSLLPSAFGRPFLGTWRSSCFGKNSPSCVDRPAFFSGGQSPPAARTLAILHHHTGDAASMASALGGEAVDVCSSGRSPADQL
jgi:hypothetical protein